MPTLSPLTAEQLASFDHDGYVRLGRIADDEEVAALLEAEARFRPSNGDRSNPTEASLLVREQLCHHSVAVRRFCIAGAHVALLPQLLGPDVAFTHTQFITKLPGPRPDGTFVPLHQDDGYGTLDPAEDVTVWTALTDTDESNGCLVVEPGSHRRGLIRHEPSDLHPALREAPGGSTVPVPLAAGEAVAFTGLTLHGSGPNHSDRPRVGLHARYCLPWAIMLTERNRPVLRDAHSWMVTGEAPVDGGPSAADAGPGVVRRR